MVNNQFQSFSFEKYQKWLINICPSKLVKHLTLDKLLFYFDSIVLDNLEDFLLYLYKGFHSLFEKQIIEEKYFYIMLIVLLKYLENDHCVGNDDEICKIIKKYNIDQSDELSILLNFSIIYNEKDLLEIKDLIVNY